MTMAQAATAASVDVISGLVVLREPNLAVVGSQFFERLVLLFADVFVLELLLTDNVNGHHQTGNAAQGEE